MVLGLGFGSLVATSITAQAKSKYVTTPTSIRGKWFDGKNGTGEYLNIAKYTFYVVNYNHGKKDGKGDIVSGKKKIPYDLGMQLAVSKHASKSGYWSIGFNGTDGVWHLKRTKHNGKKALRCWYPNLGDAKHPTSISYYYAK